MTEFYFRNVFRLDLVDTEADHKVWHDLFFLFGFTDDFNCLIYIKQNFLHTF